MTAAAPFVVRRMPSGMRMPIASSLCSLRPATLYCPTFSNSLSERCDGSLVTGCARFMSGQLDQLYCAVGQYFALMAAGFIDELHDQETHGGAAGDDGEECRCVHKGEDGEECHAAHVAERACHAGD